MQKILLLLAIIQMLFSAVFAQNPDDYITFSVPINKAHHFQSGDNTFIDYFKNKREKIGAHEYAVKIRDYSGAKLDTSYFRMDEKNF